MKKIFILLLLANAALGQSVLITPSTPIRSSTLSGSGEREVFALSDGTLSTSPRTFTTVIGAELFRRRYNGASGTFTSYGLYGDCHMVGSNISEHLIANVSLPVGAVVRQVQVYFTDVDPNNNLRFWFGYTPLTQPGTAVVIDLYQNTANPNPSTITTLISQVYQQVGADESYCVVITPVDNTGDVSAGVWNFSNFNTMANYMSVKGVKITYTK